MAEDADKLTQMAVDSILGKDGKYKNMSFQPVEFFDKKGMPLMMNEAFSSSPLRGVIKEQVCLPANVFKPLDDSENGVNLKYFAEQLALMPKRLVHHLHSATEQEFTKYVVNHILKYLVKNGSAFSKKSVVELTCICDEKEKCRCTFIESENELTIGNSETLHGELDVVIKWGKATQGTHVNILTTSNEPETENGTCETEHDEHDEPERKKQKAASCEVKMHDTTIENITVSFSGQVYTLVPSQILSQAVTFGWLQHNMYPKSKVHGVVTIVLTKVYCRILIYYPQDDVLLVSNMVAFADETHLKVNGLLCLYLALNYPEMLLEGAPTANNLGFDINKNLAYKQLDTYTSLKHGVEYEGNRVPGFPTLL